MLYSTHEDIARLRDELQRINKHRKHYAKKLNDINCQSVRQKIIVYNGAQY